MQLRTLDFEESWDPDADPNASGVAPPPTTIAPATHGALEPGTSLGEHILLFRPLREGGMGSVWMAQHQGLGIPVAVKLLRDEYAFYPQAIARLRREAASAARIRSPHVVQVFDLGVTETGVPYIVMELLEGETLEDRVARRGRLGIEETVAIVRQVGAALAKAHDLGVVHRDIKPENLFLVDGDQDLFVKVLDFGVALDMADRADRLTVSGTAVGTPHFMSPEQTVGRKRFGPASDIWALGVVAYYCLTGALPYEGDSRARRASSVRCTNPKECRPRTSFVRAVSAIDVATCLDRAEVLSAAT